MTAPKQPFWMICRKPAGPKSFTQPKVRYSTLDAARRQAEQGAGRTGATFMILATVAEVYPTDRSFTSLFDGSEI